MSHFASVFFYEPFHDLEHFAGVLFSSEGQRQVCQAQCIRISESRVRSTTSRQGKYIRALGPMGDTVIGHEESHDAVST